VNNYITFEQLRKESNLILNESDTESFKRIIAKSEKNEGKNVFLSHSSKDIKHLPYVISFLEKYGSTVYIDKLDKYLPSSTNHQTAVELKKRITDIDKFILFATENSKDSKWMPWELGIADGIKKFYDIAILPSVENRFEETWAEQEYLSIYKKIVWGSIKGGHGEDWIVRDFQKKEATYLNEWLKQDSCRGML
jgi:hypothetical protein